MIITCGTKHVTIVFATLKKVNNDNIFKSIKPGRCHLCNSCFLYY